MHFQIFYYRFYYNLSLNYYSVDNNSLSNGCPSAIHMTCYKVFTIL